jgi:sortase (surface protein transpeptidase)
LTLSTCTTGGKKRVVVHAKRIENWFISFLFFMLTNVL